MPGYFLQNLRDSLLSAYSVKIHLLKHGWDCTTFEYCWWVFLDNSVQGFDTGLVQIDLTQLEIHRIFEALDKA